MRADRIPALAALCACALLACGAFGPRAVGAAAQDAPPPASGHGNAEGAAAPPLPSVFLSPLHLGAAPPEVRAARHLLVSWKGVPGALATVVRTRDEAAALAAELALELRGGADFDALSSTRSDAHNARAGGVLGCAGPGMLLPAMDAFLFSAEAGAVSDPIELPVGFSVIQRIEPRAAVAQIFLAGRGEDVRARAVELHKRLLAGEEFAELARAHSEDPTSAARGGVLAIYERGPSDASIKRAAFQLDVGELSLPFESPLGWHLLKRLPLDGVDPALMELTWVRARAILIAHRGTPGALPGGDRSAPEARALAEDLAARIRAGEDMAELARAHDDDFGGKQRAGDLGWVHRHAPRKLPALDRLFPAKKGELLGPIPFEGGWILLRRES